MLCSAKIVVLRTFFVDQGQCTNQRNTTFYISSETLHYCESSLATPSQGVISEDFLTPANLDFSSGGTAIWGNDVLAFNPGSNEVNFIGDVGQGAADVILQADETYELNQGNGSIFNVTDPANVFEVLPIANESLEVTLIESNKHSKLI